MDEFVIAHTVGWWAKALMLRHSGMCVRVARTTAGLKAPHTPPILRLWVGSILFELSELSLQVRARWLVS